MTSAAPTRTKQRPQLRVRLDSGIGGIPLDRIYRLTGYATLSGEPEDYFVGWLTFHGEQIPVFDLNRVLCEQPTPETFGTRIAVIETSSKAPTRHLGLLAAGATDTTEAEESVTAVELDSFLPMLYTLTPEPPLTAPSAVPS